MQYYNFFYLFVGLLVLLLVQPVAQTWVHLGSLPVMDVPFTILLIVGVWSLRPYHQWFVPALVIVVAALVTAGLVVRAGDGTWLALHIGVVIAFCLLTITVGLRAVLAGGAITPNHLIGSMSVYLLLGVLWALLYALAHQLLPGAFHGLETGTSRAAQVSELFYFSFITLTTVGYGDVAPAHPFVRTLSMLQGVTGQLYIAILVASLVGRHITTSPDRDDSEPA